MNEQEIKELEDINDSVITNTSAICIAEDAKPQLDEKSQNEDEEQEEDVEKENDTYL